MRGPAGRAPAAPWGRFGIIQVVAANSLGALGIFVAWLGTSHALTPRSQAPWVAIGALAVVVTGAGNGLSLLEGRSAIHRRRGRVLAVGDAGGVAPDPDGERVTASDSVVVAVVGTVHYHRADCLLVRGKAVVRGAGAREDRTACGMCQPGPREADPRR